MFEKNVFVDVWHVIAGAGSWEGVIAGAELEIINIC